MLFRSDFGSCAGTAFGFVSPVGTLPNPTLFDPTWIFRITSWGWPWIVRGVAIACAENPAVCAIPAILGSVVLMESDVPRHRVPAAPAKAKPQSNQSSTTMHSDHPECDAQYERDADVCRKRRTSTCWASAMERWVQCSRVLEYHRLRTKRGETRWTLMTLVKLPVRERSKSFRRMAAEKLWCNSVNLSPSRIPLGFSAQSKSSEWRSKSEVRGGRRRDPIAATGAKNGRGVVGDLASRNPRAPSMEGKQRPGF